MWRKDCWGSALKWRVGTVNFSYKKLTMSEVMHPSDLLVSSVKTCIIAFSREHWLNILMESLQGMSFKGLLKDFVLASVGLLGPAHESVCRNMQSAMENLGWLKITLRKRCTAKTSQLF